MSPLAEIFYELLDAALHPNAACPSIENRIDDTGWKQLYALGSRQGVLTLLWDGIRRLPAAEKPPREIRIRWALNAEQQEKRSRHQLATAAELASFYARNGIRTLVLKGLGTGLDYPVPEHRECGDIDLYLFGEQKRGDALIRETGIEVKSAVPKHSGFVFRNVEIENHRTFLNVKRNRDERGIDDLLLTILEREGTRNHPYGFSTPSATFDAIFLIRHAATHFLREGIAARHLCDWACFLERRGAQVDKPLFVEAAERFRMNRFAALMTAAAVRHLGVQADTVACDPALLDRFMEDLLAFGTEPVPRNAWKRLFRKIRMPLAHRWRHEQVMESSVWKFYLEMVRAQWREGFTLFS